MKIASLFFRDQDCRRQYLDALRRRLSTIGYQPHEATEYVALRFPPKKLQAYITGTDDAERAADVALEIRGVTCKVREE